MNIRGIPIDKLAKARILPQLTILNSGWFDKARFDPVAYAGSASENWRHLWIILIVFLFINSGGMFFVTVAGVGSAGISAQLFVGLIYFFASIGATMISFLCITTYLKAKAFTNAVNRLDELLKTSGHKDGIYDITFDPELSRQSSRQKIWFCNFFKGCLQVKIYAFAVDRAKLDPTQEEPAWLKEKRKNFIEFAELCEKFNMELGQHCPYLTEAEKRLAKESVRENELKKLLADEAVAIASWS